jgi:hypothetical protein
MMRPVPLRLCDFADGWRVPIPLVQGDEIQNRLLWLRESAHGIKYTALSGKVCSVVYRETLSNVKTKTGGSLVYPPASAGFDAPLGWSACPKYNTGSAFPHVVLGWAYHPCRRTRYLYLMRAPEVQAKWMAIYVIGRRDVELHRRLVVLEK